MPRIVAWPLVAGVLVLGLRAAQRDAQRPRRAVLVDADAARILLDDCPLDGVWMHWRGPLACLAWRDARGRRQSLVWWPDTLPPAKRRELRLAASGFRAPPRAGTVAP